MTHIPSHRDGRYKLSRLDHSGSSRTGLRSWTHPIFILAVVVPVLAAFIVPFMTFFFAESDTFNDFAFQAVLNFSYVIFADIVLLITTWITMYFSKKHRKLHETGHHKTLRRL